MHNFFIRAQGLALAIAAAALLLPATAYTQTISFPDSPLQTAASISVKPNLLFMLDDSGSMGQQYTPDQISAGGNWYDGAADERMCYDSGDNNNTNDVLGEIVGFNRICQVGDVAYMASFFNSQYYNPAIQYRPGVKADGTSYASQNSAATSAYTSVRTDMYNVNNNKMEGGSATNANLTQFPERVWCTAQGDDVNDTAKCKANGPGGWIYPNVSFPYGRTSGGSIKYRGGQPYYYNIINFEYCTAADMTDCVVANAPTTSGGKSYSVPSILRWCKYTGGTALLESDKLDLKDCRARYDTDNKYTYPRFLGRVVPDSALKGAVATIKFGTTPLVTQDITSITIDGANILNGPISGQNSRTALAILVAASINARNGTPEFMACAGATGACNAYMPSGTSSNDTVYIYPTGTSGSIVRELGDATNAYGTPQVVGTASNPGTRSKATISVTSLGGTGTPLLAGVNQITIGGVNVLSGARDFATPNTPADVATSIAAGINGGPQNAVFSATASGSDVTVERIVVGSYFDGTTIAFDYTGTARSPAGSAVVSTANNTAKTIAIKVGSNNTCTANVTTLSTISIASGNANDTTSEVAATLRTALNAQGYPTGVSGSTISPSLPASDGGSAKNGYFMCFTTTGGVTLPASITLSNGRYSMLGKLTATTFSGGVAVGVIPSTVTEFSGGFDLAATAFRTGQANWTKTVVVTGRTYPKVTSRSDCTGSACTYDEEMTNFANWYTFYRTRMQSMKSAGGQAFAALSDNFRVGFTTINDTSGADFVKIRDFTAAQKTAWYAKFYSQVPGSSTPLRQALSRAGRIYSGLNPLTSNYEDPVQYSCQQNFVLLTTDGYWNETGETNIKKEDGTRVDNVDGGASVATPFFDGGPGYCPSGNPSDCLGTTCHGATTNTSKFSSCNTLADVAYWYATTDLRRTGLANCSNQTDATNTNNLCTNDVKTSPKDSVRTQHMTTFSLGLGVDGLLSFQDDYETASTGDYADIRSGTKNWPQVKNLHPSAVDDLWHAAVNGRGKYFSAKDPESLSKGLKGALAEVNAQGGSGAAAATSNLEPVAGDNFVYVGSYVTIKWTGNLEARQIDLATGDVSVAPQWCVENVIDPVTNNISCTGTMNSMVQGGTDTRTIYTFDSAATNKLKPFMFGSLTAAQQAMFATTGLSQYSGLDTAAQAVATAQNLVNFLRGQYQYDTRSSNAVKAFRERERTLGDVIGSQPIYVKKPAFTYNDTDYSAYVTAQTSRTGTVYIGANDGMLHAFDSSTGVERWAYVPSPMLPKMRQLADVSYPTNHRFYVDGSPKVGDVYSGGSWRTILVGGYSSGAVGYYALDITDPNAPKALWEFPPSTELDAGNGFSAPLITKLSNGTWVVIISSGYNNSGQGYVYVLNAVTGAQIRKIATGVGTLASPSGLGRLTGFAPGMPYDNTTTKVYGGDLYGNLWRFDPSTGAVAKIAGLKDGSGNTQPITTKVELVRVDTQTLLYVATGKYLETSDLSNSQTQTFYAIRDTFDADGTNTDPRSVLNRVTLTDAAAAGGGFSRTSTGSTGNITTSRGFYADLPVSGERVNIDPQFVNGTVVLLSNIPSNTACTAGGTSFITFFDYKNGAVLTGSGDFAPAIVVGFVTVKVGNSFIPLITRADSPNPQRGAPVPTSEGDTRYRGRRVSWKELNVD